MNNTVEMNETLIRKMLAYYSGDPARIQHYTKVYTDAVIDRVCYLIGHHHTYSNIVGLDYQILVEADFLVNLYEDHADKQAIQTAIDRIFITKSGTEMAHVMFNV